MARNMGGTDRIIRILIAIIIAILYFTDRITGTTGMILGIIAIIFLITGFTGFCPLYKPFGISTAKKEKDKTPPM